MNRTVPTLQFCFLLSALIGCSALAVVGADAQQSTSVHSGVGSASAEGSVGPVASRSAFRPDVVLASPPTTTEAGIAKSLSTARPTVSMAHRFTGSVHEQFVIDFFFSEGVTGFGLADISVDHARIVSAVSGSGGTYLATFETEANYEGTIQVTVRDEAANNSASESSHEGRYIFLADNRAPGVVRAEVVRDELGIVFSEDLDESANIVPFITDFTVEITRDGRTSQVPVADVEVMRDEVVLTLASVVRFGDAVALDYTVGTRPVRDLAGNVAAGVAGLLVRNRTQRSGLPGIPRNLTADADGGSVIELNWDAPRDDGGADIVGYEIEVSDDGGSTWSLLTQDTRNATTRYRHAGLDPGTTRHYRVAAINEHGAGRSSNVASATTDSGIPDAPRRLSAAAVGESAIDLDWSAPLSNGGSAVTGYRVEVRTSIGGRWSVLEADTRSRATEYRHTGLAAGATRYYRVSAINANGTGRPSTVANATTAASLPDAPRALRAVPGGSFLGREQIVLTWSRPTSDGGSAVSGYRIETSQTGSGGWTVLEANTGRTLTRYTHGSLSPGTTHHYRVAAVNGQGTGAYSNVASATTDAGAPSSPRNVRALGRSSSSIEVSWQPPLNDGGAAVTGYAVERARSVNGPWQLRIANTGTTETSYTDTGLTPVTVWYYRVTALNRAGASSPSGAASARTFPGPPDAPSGLRATAQGATRIELRWTAPSQTNGAAVLGYRIEQSRDGGRTWLALRSNTATTATTFIHTGLPPGTTRHYRVSAINGAGTGEPSNVASAMTAAVPGAVRNLSARSTGTNRIDLTWTAPSANAGAPVTGYRIEVSETGGAWRVLVANTRSAATAYSHIGLSPGTQRFYRVSAINEAGAGAVSNIASATTDATPPGVPTSLTARPQGTDRINLSWSPPSIDGGSPVTGYRIEASDDGGVRWVTLIADTRSVRTLHSDTGLQPATTRHYRVSAVNAAGTGEPSSTANATTDAAAPDPPTGLRAAARGSEAIELRWNAPRYTGGAAVTGYRIEVSRNGGRTWTTLRSNTGTAATTFVHENLRPVTTRHYRVSAINRAGASDWSNEASATTEAVVPGVPGALRALALGTAQIDLSWRAPGNDGGAPVHGYRVEVSEDAGATWQALVADTRNTTTRYSHIGLAPASTRHYRIRAVNRIGAGEPSRVASATTDATVPDAPAKLTATATSPTQIDLAWTAPAYDGGAAVTGYRIEVSETGAAWTDLAQNTHSTATAYSHSGLVPGSQRFYRVSAINRAGTGAVSAVANAQTDDPVQRAGRLNTRVLPHVAAAMTASTTGAIADRIDAVAAGYGAGTGAEMGGLQAMAARFGDPGMGGGRFGASSRDSRMGLWDLLDGASFQLALGGDGSGNATTGSASQRDRFASPTHTGAFPSPTGIAGSRQPGTTSGTMTAFSSPSTTSQLRSGPAMSVWGAGEYQHLGEPNAAALGWSGGLASFHIGADVRIAPDILGGVAVSHSTGSFNFTDKTGAGPVEGEYGTAMTSVNPYLAWLPGGRGNAVWATGGFGWGDVEIDDEREDLRMSPARTITGALGGAYQVLATGGGAVRVKADGWAGQITVDGAAGVGKEVLNLQRGRLLLELTQGYRTGANEVGLSVEGGMRYDNGDGANGAGMEAGGGLRFANHRFGLTVEGRGRVLVTGREGYEEWGVGGMFQFDPGSRGQGLSIRLSPTYGDAASGLSALWDRGVSAHSDNRFPATAPALDGELAYGFASRRGTPYGGFHLTSDGRQAFSSGVRYDLGPGFGLRLEGTRRDNGTGASEHTIGIRGRVRLR